MSNQTDDKSSFSKSTTSKADHSEHSSVDKAADIPEGSVTHTSMTSEGKTEPIHKKTVVSEAAAQETPQQPKQTLALVTSNSKDAQIVPGAQQPQVAANLGDIQPSASDRGEWGNKLDFMMSCIGFAVGLGNIWRFPYLCYKNGGGAFLIPYLICLVFSGIPVFLMENLLGQLLGRGFISIWSICPILKGVGYSSLILVFWLDTYYIVVIGWSLYYLLQSFRFELPWAKCNHDWNTAACRSDDDLQATCRQYYTTNESISATLKATLNTTAQLSPQLLSDCKDGLGETFQDPVREYWDRHVLQTTPSIETTGGMIWGTCLTLIAAWCICFWAMYKGIRTTGKVVYVTALFPYFCLVILFIRGVTLEGAWNGIRYYLKPDLKRILDPNVWNDAATQIFFSYGLGVGAWIALSSYNKFNNNVLRDTIIISVVNACTAIFSGCIVFSIIGFMAHQQNKDVADVAESGSGLTFIVYPSATLKMPFVQLWSVLFFSMMIMLGLGSQFVQLESFFTGVIDEFPSVLRDRRPLFIAIVSLVAFGGALGFVSKGGIYWFEIFDYYAASGFALLYLIFFEVVAIFWFYGTDNFVVRIEFMLNSKLSRFWIFCWKYVTPVICLLIFIFSLIHYKPITYMEYHYPNWAIAFGWFLASSSMLAVPLYALGKFITASGTMQERLSKLINAKHDEIDQIIRNRANTVASHATKPLPWRIQSS